MTILRIFLTRLRALFRKQKLEDELADEIQAHLELQIEDHLRQGMSPEEARYLALRKFGGVEQMKETYRDRRSLTALETLFRDLRYGVRMLRRNPGMTAVAILSLALGIGANTALFSVVDAVLLKTLPVEEPERLVLFEWQAGKAFRLSGMSGTSNVAVPPGSRGLSLFRYDVFEKMRQAQQAGTDGPLTDLFAFGPLREVTANVGDQAQIIKGQAVSGNYYSGLRVHPSLGRAITVYDDQSGAGPVVVLSYQFWRDRLGANPNVVGQSLKLNQTFFTIIGVTPPAFNSTLQVGFHPDVTIPLALEPLLKGDRSNIGQPPQSGGVWWLNLMGRLKSGATQEQARESLNGVFQDAALAVMPPPRKSNQPAQLEPKDYPRLMSESGSRGMLDVRKNYTPTIYGLFIVVALVLLIACANLANLLLARATSRRPEISLRLSLGASRWRLIQQLLTESVLLAILGGIVGVFFAFWGKSVLTTFANDKTGLLPSGVELSLNWRVLVFTLAVSVLTGVLFGLAPAWRATRLDLNTALKQSGRTTTSMSRLSKGLLVVQVAVSGLILAGAGLFIRTLYNLQHVELGFNQENLLVFRLQPEQSGYEDERLMRFYQQLFDRFDHLPDVSAATFAKVELIADDNWIHDFLLPGENLATAVSHVTMRQTVRENYFATMETPFLRGRQFTPQDDEHAPLVAIVNQTFQRKFFPNEDMLGKRITINEKHEIEIVGLVADTKYMSQREELQPLLYTPWRQETSDVGEMYFALRTKGDPTALVPAVRNIVHELDNNLPVTEISTQTARAQTTLGQERLYVRLFSFFGVLALALAAIGLFGVLAYSVSQRTKEIGIRMAFGARVMNVILMVVGQGMKLVLLGLVLGGLLGYALMRPVVSEYLGTGAWQQAITQQLYGVTVSDPLTLIAMASLLTVVALFACWLPARRAAKVDPLVALRYE